MDTRDPFRYNTDSNFSFFHQKKIPFKDRIQFPLFLQNLEALYLSLWAVCSAFSTLPFLEMNTKERKQKLQIQNT